jgi:hypothetical protein
LVVMFYARLLSDSCRTTYLSTFYISKVII